MIKIKLFGHRSSEKSGQVPQDAPSAMETAPVNPNGKCVLIVDDDPVFLAATGMKLRSAGYHVSTAREGSEAIAALGERQANAVLLDVNFPPDVCNGGMASWDGFQLMSWLRGQPGAKGARFIMVSISDSESDKQRARQLGTVAYFHKPVDHEKLLAALNAAN